MLPITVIITTFNDSEYLENAILSVINQSCQPSEIIIVDDGSRDLTAFLICSKLRRIFNNIIYIYQSNFGVSSARNLGIRKSSFSFICFLDADDQMLFDNLEYKYSILKNLPSHYFGVYGSFINNNSNKKERFLNFNGLPEISKIGLFCGVPGSSPSYLFNKNNLLEINGFDFFLNSYEDFDLIIRLILNQNYCYGDNHAGFIRNIRSNSSSRNTFYLKSMISINKFLMKAKANNYYHKYEIEKKIKRNYFKFIVLNYFNLNLINNIDSIHHFLFICFSIAKPVDLIDYLFYSIYAVFKLTKKDIFRLC